MQQDLKAKVVDFWDSRPCNIRHSAKRVGTIDYSLEVLGRRYSVEPHIPGFAKFDSASGKSVLEVGCGIGSDTIMFAAAGASVTAVDISRASLDVCRDRLASHGLTATLVECDAESLSSCLAPGKFDIVYSFGVLHHTPYPARALDEIRKFCGPDTVIRVMLYSKWSWKGIGFFLTDGWRFGFSYSDTLAHFAEAQPGCPVAVAHDRRSLARLLSGFEVTSISKAHIFPYRVAPYTRGVLSKRLVFRLMPGAVYRLLCRLLGWHYLVEMKIKND